MGCAFIRTLSVVAAIALAFVVPARADDAAVPKGLEASDWSSIRAAYEAHRHAVVADESTPGHYRARNPGQQWLTRFDGRGFLTSPDAGGWFWGLELISYGRGETQRTIGGSACIQTKGTRVEYEWNGALTEWYINDQRGFEHGYTLRERPEGVTGPDGLLHFTLAVRGDLQPRVSENGRDVAFTTAESGSDTTALNYNNLKVFDADGVHLAASFQSITTAAGTPALRLTIDDTHARYPLTIDPTAQQAYFKASSTTPALADANDAFGWPVAVSGDTVVVGADLEDSNATGVNGNQADNSAPTAGAAYVFVRTGTAWAQQAYLKASNTGAGDGFGTSVAIAGDTIVVGAGGEASGATGVNGNQADNSATDAGAAYVFVRAGTTWTQQAYLKASNTGANDSFGGSVAISGDTVVVGADGEDSGATGVNGNQANNTDVSSGAAYVFIRSGTTWTQQAYLKASNTEANDLFGGSVAIVGDTVVVGAAREDSNATGVNGNQFSNIAPDAGAAYVFVRTGTTWTQQAYLKASNTGLGDEFGTSVAVAGDTVVIGAPFEDSNATGVNGNQADNSASASGAAYVFVRSGTTWSQQAYLKASNTGGLDDFGLAVAISGDTIVIGALGERSNATGVNGNQTDTSAPQSGAAYVFVRAGTTWTQQAYLKASNTGAGDSFGHSVAISGDTVVVGADFEDSNATGVNGNQADNSASSAGAAYVFVRSGTTWTQQAYVKARPTATDAGDFFGISVAVSGDTVVVGATGEDSYASGVNGDHADNSVGNSGAAYVFVRSGPTWAPQAYLKASNTGLGDKFGTSVAIAGDTIVVGAPLEDSASTGINGNQADNSATDAGAAYVFVRAGTTWTQQAYLKASNTGAGDSFGHSVAISGDTVVVGAESEDSNATGVNGNQADNSATSSGAAYVFVRPPSGNTWTQQAYLKASNTAVSDNFGDAVSVSGDTVVVGASLEDSGARGINGDQADNSAGNSGAAYVFVRTGTTWTQQAYLKASNTGAGDTFGSSVAIAGDTVVVGAHSEDSNATGVNGNQANETAANAGAAYVFARSAGGSTWVQRAYLKASNTGAGDGFGSSVAVSGGTIVVGAMLEDSNATGVNGTQSNNSAIDAGAAYVFFRSISGTTWSQRAYFKASNTGASDAFGSSVAISGDTVVVGSSGESSNATGINGNQADDSATDAGAAYVFVLGLPTPSSPLATPATVCSGASSALSVSDPGAGIVIDWFTGSCGGTLIGTGNPFNVTPSATTTYFARARRTSDGNTSDACASVVVTVDNCCPADFNGDGFLDFTDFDGFVAAFEAGDTSGDFNADGFIDFTDFDAYVSAFEAGC